MKFILNKQIKYYTKETFRWINLIGALLFIVMTIILMKYKPVYSVSISEEQIGYIKNKYELEEKVQEMIEKEGTNNIAYVDIKVEPEYQFTLVSRKEQTNLEQIVAKIEEQTQITYKYYAVTLDGEQKTVVDSLEEAENLVTEMQEEHKNSTKIVNIAISEVYAQDKEEYDIVDVKVAKEEVAEELQEIEDATVNGVYLSQKPITGRITSRFGNRESIRTYNHTGLDIAAPYGTEIKAAAGGTVTWSGYKGSYGNLVIIDCGNNVEIYYGHCSKLNVKKGQEVKAGDVIGKVGSTGNSTGNHLHFEIRVNGTRVNPQNYIYSE